MKKHEIRLAFLTFGRFEENNCIYFNMKRG